MISLEMDKPYKLDKKSINEIVKETSPGNYALGKKNKEGFHVLLVGRSDSDINGKLKYWVNKTKNSFFKFSYASSKKDAFEKECRNYHDFEPPENKVHPNKPRGSKLKCPICGQS